MKNLPIILFFCMLFPIISCFNNLEKNTPEIKNGYLDLSDWDFDIDGPINLHGSCEFYWKKLLTPDDFINNSQPEITGYYQIPKVWNNYIINKQNLSGDGYATYRFYIKTSDIKQLSLSKLHFNTAFKIWINNDLVSNAGIVGTDQKSVKPGQITAITDFNGNGHGIEIVIQISNYSYALGGIWDTIKIGRKEQIHKQYRTNLAFDMFLFGGLIIVSLFYFGLFSLRKKYNPTFWFALFSGLIALRSIVTNETYILNIFPSINWELLVKLNFLTFLLGLLVFTIFNYYLYPKMMSKKITLFICIWGAINSLIVVFLPAQYYSKLLLIFHLYLTIGCSYYFIIIIKIIKKSSQGAIILLVGSILLIGATANDMLVANNLIQTIQLTPVGLFLFIILQAFLIAQRIANVFSKVEELSENLDKKVKHRTEELLLANSSLKKAKDALWGEMELAKKIQTLLVPDKPEISGYEITAYMKPADYVGGDYYDVINSPNKNWIIIGDVSGHGVPAGLVMMMVQTSIQTILREFPEIKPSELLRIVSKTLKYNIGKLDEDKYMTITALSVDQVGEVIFSGLHQDMLIYRAATNNVEIVETYGIWLSSWDLHEGNVNLNFSLSSDDVLLLFTDGIIESLDTNKEIFSKNKLIQILRDSGTLSTNNILENILNASDGYTTRDDTTIVIVKKNSK